MKNNAPVPSAQEQPNYRLRRTVAAFVGASALAMGALGANVLKSDEVEGSTPMTPDQLSALPHVNVTARQGEGVDSVILRGEDKAGVEDAGLFSANAKQLAPIEEYVADQALSDFIQAGDRYKVPVLPLGPEVK